MALISSVGLFPPYSLDTSILAAVLVGVVLLALLTETLGWVFVGLVVPGYLASVFVIHPEAGVTVTVEAVLTYLVALGLSRGVRGTGAWSEFFGRDRFYVIVLASVLVRGVSEVVVLPSVGRWLDAQLGTTFTLDRTLHSIGLVLVPLTANAFWKLHLRRGLLQVAVPVALTYALLRWVLLPHTNLSFSSLELTYEDVAQDFLSSPKAYILLLTTALLAARFNLRYGWDFNGILVPALIALTWLTPGKMLATLGEVLALVFATRALLALPGLKTLNLEGPRKTVLVFFLGFVLKWCIGWALGGRVPGLKVTDLFGFGYLVPTLLAVKMLQKQVVARILFATVQTSLTGVVVGSLLGFGLSLVEPRPASAVPGEDTAREGPALRLARSPLGVMALGRATARESESADVPLPHRRGELRPYEALWRAVGSWLASGSAEGPRAVRKLATPLGLDLLPVGTAAPGQPQRYALVEREGLGTRRGWDTALLVPGAKGPVLEVPRPLTEAPSAEAAALLCERVQCRAVVVSGVDTRGGGLHAGDALLERRTPLQSTHAALAGTLRVQVRVDEALPRGRPLLHVRQGGRAPPEALWPGAARTAEPPPEPGVAWEEGEVAVLRAHPLDLLAVVAGARPQEEAPPVAAGGLLAALVPPAAPAPAAVPAPSAAELLVLERQVAAPLLGLGQDVAARAPEAQRVAWARAMAGLLGMQVRAVEGCAADRPCWLVASGEQEPARMGAALVVRPDGAPIALEAPAAGPEAGTLPAALEAWQDARGRALVLADPALGTGPDAPHAASPGQVRTAFQAFHQAVHRDLADESGLLLLVRGFSSRPHLGEDVLVTLDGPVVDPASRPAALSRLLGRDGALAWLGQRARYADGAPELAGLADASPARRFSRAFGGARVATLWLSERLRGTFLVPRHAADSLPLAHLGAEPLEARSPVEDVLAEGLGTPAGEAPRALQERFAAMRATAERLLVQQSVHDLLALGRLRRAGPVEQRVRAAFSAEHGLPYLVLEARQGRHVLRAVYFLQDHLSPLPSAHLAAGAPGVRGALERALRHRTPVVLAGELDRPEPKR